MKGMTIRAMISACNGTFFGDESILDKEVSGIAIDSRKVMEGGAFIAIKGERSDGHSFIQQCLDNGALCCFAERKMENIKGSYIQVKSSVEALMRLAELYRSSLNVKVVGITGSVGKTSTKETVATVLSEKYNVLKTQGNFNNEIGLPLTVFNMTEETEVAVLEMGISDFNEMTDLARIARPDIGIITNIGLCHLENLKTRDGIMQAKTEMFDFMDKDDTYVLNGDDDKLVTISEIHGKKPAVFGIENKAGIFADKICDLGLEGTTCTIHGLETVDGKRALDVMIPIPGKHMVYNAMAAAAVAETLGLTGAQIKNGLKNLETIAGRNHIIKKNSYLIIDDCYNANPVSMKASIDVLNTAKGRKVCILGDMFELGKNEKQMHFDVGEYLGSKSIDILITAGQLASNIGEGLKDYLENHYGAHSCVSYIYETRDEMLSELDEILKPGDNILVKASHGMEFTEVIKYLEK